MFYDHMKKAVEALLFAHGQPLSAAKISNLLEIPEESVLTLIAKLMEDMDNNDRGLTVIEVAGGFQLCTRPELISIVEKLAHVQEMRLSSAAMETLAIIAFRQPITRQEIEAVRGVNADKMVSNLLERGFIKEMGRKEAIGRPILYGTTEQFLQCFGLKDLHDLPPLADFLRDSEAAANLDKEQCSDNDERLS